MKYTIVMEKGRESGFIAYCPALRGCVAQGETQRTALKNLKTAARDYIECLIEDGLPVPLEVGKRFLDLETGNLDKIIDGAGLTIEEFVDLL